jgi:hypothetical protein
MSLRAPILLVRTLRASVFVSVQERSITKCMRRENGIMINREQHFDYCTHGMAHAVLGCIDHRQIRARARGFVI